MKKVYFKTYGCQMNEHDSQKMEALLQGDGYCKTSSAGDADLIVINTCSIREKSYHKALSQIGKRGKESLKSSRKSVIAVTGCVASHEGDRLLKRFPFVDIVAGPDHMGALPELVRESEENHKRVSVTDFHDLSDYEFPTPVLWNDNSEKRIKAYVTIMKGCDNTCSFCIVPLVRGKEVSRASSEIIDEIHRLEEQGIREVMLLGQNVNSYGKRLSEKANFAKLLRRIDEETTLSRIRYTSPHPKDLSMDLVREYQKNKKLCPHIHLPVQSGSNRVLKRMRRSYTREVYLRKVERLRQARPDITITTDIIVGFPGETDRDFEETLSLVQEVSYDSSYSFSFSPRPNTEASIFADDVPIEVKKERLARLQALQSEISLRKHQSLVGQVEPVLIEGPSKEMKGQLTGRTPHGRIVNFHGDEERIGDILDIEITEVSAYSLKGKRCL